MDRRGHWNNVFTEKDTSKVSWFQKSPTTSLQLIARYSNCKHDYIIDIGGGDSTLPDYLVKNGYSNIDVLDISESALSISKLRMSEQALKVNWIESDVLKWLPTKKYHIWHDRAVFHFLINKNEQALYKSTILSGLEKGGVAIIATFAKNKGPIKCSELNICQHDKQSIAKIFSPEFEVVDSFEQIHQTPSGGEQIFSWNMIKKI